MKKLPRGTNICTINDHILEKGILMPNGQVVLMEPLYVYKKVYSRGGAPCVANLIIPTGAFVNLATTSDLKFRASEAICYSIVSKNGKHTYPLAVSTHNSNYQYYSAVEAKVPEETIAKAAYDYTGKLRKNRSLMYRYVNTPTYKFSTSLGECESGIHFFLDQDHALKY